MRPKRKPLFFKEQWRVILARRSMLDKIAIALDGELAPVDELPFVRELVEKGVMVWIDRARLPMIAVDRATRKITHIGINTDIYQLTINGIRLCDENGIKRQ